MIFADHCESKGPRHTIPDLMIRAQALSPDAAHLLQCGGGRRTPGHRLRPRVSRRADLGAFSCSGLLMTGMAARQLVAEVVLLPYCASSSVVRRGMQPFSTGAGSCTGCRSSRPMTTVFTSPRYLPSPVYTYTSGVLRARASTQVEELSMFSSGLPFLLCIGAGLPARARACNVHRFRRRVDGVLLAFDCVPLKILSIIGSGFVRKQNPGRASVPGARATTRPITIQPD